MHVADLPTPALVLDADALEANLATMAAACPGDRLRPHVKAHKCTALAAEQARHGHTAFTCATPREAAGLAAAGVGADLLVANEVVDPARLRMLAEAAQRVRVTIAVDSDETVAAAAAAGLRDVLVDVNVGLPRCGCAPGDAGRLAERARRAGLTVRGVMGYEGHLMGVVDRAERAAALERAVESLLAAHVEVGGEIVSSGGTGTYDLHDGRVTEIQAGSYALMDSHYARLGLPFVQSLFVVGTVVSVSPRWSVADVGLKALGMDHGDPTIAGATVRFCSDEHVTFADDGGVRPRVGERVRVVPAHCDPTVAMHEQVWLLRGDEVLERWAIDLRGW